VVYEARAGTCLTVPLGSGTAFTLRPPGSGRRRRLHRMAECRM